jgi:pimeloyl-ACP methyl ester carboxylesterase
MHALLTSGFLQHVSLVCVCMLITTCICFVLTNFFNASIAAHALAAMLPCEWWRQSSQPDATARISCARLCYVSLDLSVVGSETYEFEAAAVAVMAAINAILPGSSREVVLVGYSLGARLALYLSTHFGDKFKMVVSISGSAGIAGKVQCLLLHARLGGIVQNELLEVSNILHA